MSTYYHDGTGAFPGIGDTIYTDVNGNNPLLGYYYFINDIGPDYYILSASGTIIANPGSCSGGGGPTS